MTGLQVATTFALLGLIWVVQLVQYPAFRRLPEDVFRACHRHHCNAITPIVAPLLVGEAISLIALWGDPAAHPLQPWIAASAAPAWISTVLVQVPLHRRLARGADAHTIDRLVGSNWIRTAAWSAKAALVAATLA